MNINLNKDIKFNQENMKNIDRYKFNTKHKIEEIFGIKQTKVAIYINN
jgi:hypothetical protein